MIEEPIRVTGGLIAGTGDAGGAVRSYRGIPFAAPPVGALRWRAPQPVVAWSGVRLCDRFGSVCQQPLIPRNSIMSLFSFAEPPECGMSEDCLYLNVWTAARSAEERRPVIVWIFGGGHRVGGGSHPVSWGTELARRGAVVVTFNYRLGALGFLAHPALTAEAGSSGNYGTMDVIAALRWVRDNIAAFGGDRSCVTIYGQSAGAAEASIMMASPEARGLFHRAIGASGGRFDGGLGAPMPDRATAERAGAGFIDSLGAKTVEAMRDLPADTLYGPRGLWGPIVDGTILPRSVDAVFAKGEQAQVPLITGFTTEEGSPYPMPELQSRNGLAEFARKHFAGPWYKAAAETFHALYPARDDGEALAQSYRLRRDAAFAYQAWRWLRLHTAANHPGYLYCFSRPVPLPPQRRFREPVPPGGYGSWHGSELWYVFDTLETQDFPWQGADRDLADAMSSAWFAFARDGKPGGDWSAFTANAPVAALFGDPARHGPPPNRAALEFFERYYAATRVTATL